MPFVPSFDIRKIITIDEVMRKENLGPNGALIRAAEIIEARLSEILEAASALRADFLIFDTPGQMEIFLFRALGPRLASSLKGRTVSIFLIDPLLMKKRNDFVVLKMLGLIVELRLGVPSVEIVNKSDLLEKDSVRIMEQFTEKDIEELSGSLAQELYRIVDNLEKKKHTLMVSAVKTSASLNYTKLLVRPSVHAATRLKDLNCGYFHFPPHECLKDVSPAYQSYQLTVSVPNSQPPHVLPSHERRSP